MRETRVVLDRGGLTESAHAVRVAVWRDGQLAAEAGDVDSPTFMRSSAKPIQALAAVLTGAADRFRITADELALGCGSHSGEEFHVATARGLIERAGLSPAVLLCGAHPPIHGPTAARMSAAGAEPTPLHNNCSGKHAAMLASCVAAGWPTDDYVNPEHPLQRMNRENVATFAGVAAADVRFAVDGCSVPVFAVPLAGQARAAAAWTTPSGAALPEPLRAAAERIGDAMAAAPRMVGGTGRVDSDVIRVTRGRVLCKVGGEGVWALGERGRSLGIAVKSADGTPRAAYHTGLALLRSVGALSDVEWEDLVAHNDTRRRNHRGLVIGSVRVDPAAGARVRSTR
jgi:L-asparaginase II